MGRATGSSPRWGGRPPGVQDKSDRRRGVDPDDQPAGGDGRRPSGRKPAAGACRNATRSSVWVTRRRLPALIVASWP